MRRRALALAASAALLTGAAPGPPLGMLAMDISVTSPAFVAGSPIPARYTCDGLDESPPLAWTDVPQNARSIAIVFEDTATGFAHWIVFGISPQTRGAPEAASIGVSGTNDYGRTGYSGPCPTPGAQHEYRVTIYGLDEPLTLEPDTTRVQLERAMQGHVVAGGYLIGSYYR